MSCEIEVIDLTSESLSPASPPPMDPMFGEFFIENSEFFNYNPVSSPDGVFLNFSPVSSPMILDGDVENLIFNALEEAEEIPQNEVLEMEGENAEENEENSSDSGYVSVPDPEISSDEEHIDKKYDPSVDPFEEAKLRRIFGLSCQYWRLKNKLLQVRKARKLRKIQKRIDILAERRKVYINNTSVNVRRKVRKEIERNIERPRRGIERCFGCAKVFWLQRIRRWVRCEQCESWLCPDCSEDPDHCWSDGGLL